MSYEDFMTQKETKTVTKRYKVTEAQDAKLLEIENELGIPPSSIVRLALNCFLPKVRDKILDTAVLKIYGIEINSKQLVKIYYDS